MDRAGKRCVIYSRVSTEMQVDGFSLAAQKTCLTTFAKREELRIVGEYEDAGKSGKSIEGRPSFKRMINDIKSGLNVDYVVVYKLSRFGRNAADVLNSLELIQDYGVNLICTDEGIDSSQASGRLLISVLSAVAQIERENILEQTMNGRREKARQGLWNGGQAPYGYKLVEGKLEIDEEEAEIVRKIFEEYSSSTTTMCAIAEKLNLTSTPRAHRGNTVGGFWSDSSVRRILCNPVYVGRIEWGHRQNTKVQGIKELKRVYTTKNIIVSDGAHQPIISDDLWEKVQNKRINLKLRVRHYTDVKKVHPLTGILVCPVCGSTMTSNASVSCRLDGTRTISYKYICSRSRKGTRYERCNHRITYDADSMETLLKRAISSSLSNEAFIEDLKKEFSGNADSSLLKNELEGYQKKLKSLNINKSSLETQIDNMDYDEPNYDKRRQDLNNRLNLIYDNIYEIEDLIDEVKTKIEAYNSEMFSAEVILKVLNNFSKLYDLMSDNERKQLLKMLIKKIVPVEFDEYSNVYQLDKIEFNFPLFKNIDVINKIKSISDSELNLLEIPSESIITNLTKTVEYGPEENKIHLEPIVLKKRFGFVRDKNGHYRSAHSNKEIEKYALDNFNLKIDDKNIRFVKKAIGVPFRHSDYKSHDADTRKPTIDKWNAIIQTLLHFDMVPEESIDRLPEITESVRPFVRNPILVKEKNPYVVQYKDVIRYLKDTYNIGASSNTIKAAKHVIGLWGSEGLVSIPGEERCRRIVDALIKFKKIEDKDYNPIITKFYKNRKRKKK